MPTTCCIRTQAHDQVQPLDTAVRIIVIFQYQHSKAPSAVGRAGVKGQVTGASGPFRNVLIIGIGGSALGPQFVAHALGQPTTDKLRPFFLDNTDPDGMDKVLAQLDGELGRTLAVVISKSGGTRAE